jgi:hypothetical protein
MYTWWSWHTVPCRRAYRNVRERKGRRAEGWREKQKMESENRNRVKIWIQTENRHPSAEILLAVIGVISVRNHRQSVNISTQANQKASVRIRKEGRGAAK